MSKSSTCPECGHKTTEYKRSVSHGLCLTLSRLIKLENNDNCDYHHITSFLGKGTSADYSHLSYFDLIEKSVNIDFSKSSSGYWKSTFKGRAFLKGEVAIPKYIIVKGGVRIQKSKENVFVKDCIKKCFDFRNIFVIERSSI